MPPLSQNDSSEILELINHIQPDIPWSKEHLLWQYFETPAGPARLYGIKDPQGKLIAFYAAVAQRIRMGSRRVAARMIQDVMTHPDYRGRGLLHQLAEECCRDIEESGEVGYTFPNEKSANSFRRTGWTELCSVPWRKKSLGPTSSFGNPTLDIYEVKGLFGDVVSVIWDSRNLTVGVDRDAAYLNWRYSKPATTYFKFLVNDSEGLMVLKLYRQTLHICDLMTRSDKLKNVPAMLKFCENFGAQRGVNVITAWLPSGHPCSYAFDQYGLEMVTDVTRYVFVHPGKNTAHELTNPSLWHVTQGDSDIY